MYLKLAVSPVALGASDYNVYLIFLVDNYDEHLEEIPLMKENAKSFEEAKAFAIKVSEHGLPVCRQMGKYGEQPL